MGNMHTTPNVSPYKQAPLTPKLHTVEENEENILKVGIVGGNGASIAGDALSNFTHNEREKKRREREKSREKRKQQRMQVFDNKMLEDATPSTATTYRSDMTDIFRFSEGDENSVELLSDPPHPPTLKGEKEK